MATWSDDRNGRTLPLSAWSDDSDVCTRPMFAWSDDSDVCTRPMFAWSDDSDVCTRPMFAWSGDSDVCTRPMLAWSGDSDVCTRPMSAWSGDSEVCTRPMFAWSDDFDVCTRALSAWSDDSNARSGRCPRRQAPPQPNFNPRTAPPPEALMRTVDAAVLTALTQARTFIDTHLEALGDLESAGYRQKLTDAIAALEQYSIDQETAGRMSGAHAARQRALIAALRLNHMRPMAAIGAA